MQGSFNLQPSLKSVLLHLVQAVPSRNKSRIWYSIFQPKSLQPSENQPKGPDQPLRPHCNNKPPCLSAAQTPQQTMESPTTTTSATYPAAHQHTSQCQEGNQDSRCNKCNRCKRCSQYRHRQSPKRRKRKPSGAWSGAGPYVSCLLAAVSKEVVCYGERCEML